jgi:hypothetical protein
LRKSSLKEISQKLNVKETKIKLGYSILLDKNNGLVMLYSHSKKGTNTLQRERVKQELKEQFLVTNFISMTKIERDSGPYALSRHEWCGNVSLFSICSIIANYLTKIILLGQTQLPL